MGPASDVADKHNIIGLLPMHPAVSQDSKAIQPVSGPGRSWEYVCAVGVQVIEALSSIASLVPPLGPARYFFDNDRDALTADWKPRVWIWCLLRQADAEVKARSILERALLRHLSGEAGEGRERSSL